MVKTEFVQFRCLKEAIRVVKEPRKEPRDDKKPISSFQDLMVSTASRVRMEILPESSWLSVLAARELCSGCG